MNPDLIGKLGLPTALVVVMVAFFARGIWPWMTKQVEKSDARADAAIAAFSGLKDTLTQQTEINRRIVQHLDDLARARNNDRHP